MCTTNGSKAVEATAGARHAVLGAIVNAAAVARFLLALETEEVLLSCAGTDGAVSLDDVLGAAWVLREVVARGARSSSPTPATWRCGWWTAWTTRRPCSRSAAHARFLRSIGFGADVDFAGRANASTWCRGGTPWRRPPSWWGGRGRRVGRAIGSPDPSGARRAGPRGGVSGVDPPQQFEHERLGPLHRGGSTRSTTSPTWCHSGITPRRRQAHEGERRDAAHHERRGVRVQRGVGEAVGVQVGPLGADPLRQPNSSGDGLSGNTIPSTLV
jgi:hypothetical protein